MRKLILNFVQKPGKTFHEAWEQFKDLLKKCPYHGIAKWQINRVFYDGILEQNNNLEMPPVGEHL